MKTFVTGAGGFLGRAVLNRAQAAGHEVLAMHRPASPILIDPEWQQVRLVAGDLRQTGDWMVSAGQAEAVIHCAAAASGDLPTQLAGTVLATENLLASLPSNLQRFIHISSFSVYDFGAPFWFGHLDETTPMDLRPLRRDAYTQTKLIQEALIRDYCRDASIPLVVIRPGAIYGPGKDWDYGRALRVGRFDMIFAPLSRMRLVHVDDCATAIVAALEYDEPGEELINIVGDDQPSHWEFHHSAQKAGARTGIGIPVPYIAVLALGGAAWLASKLFFGGRARLPEWLDLPRQKARWRPLRYRNTKAKNVLGWNETESLLTGMEQMLGEKIGGAK